MSPWTIFWIVVGVAVVAWLFIGGHFLRLSNFVRETGDELKKCTWPTWAELKGSTVVVIISVGLLGLFTVFVDIVFAASFRWVVSLIT